MTREEALAKGRAKAAANRKRKKARAEREKQEKFERLGFSLTGERDRGRWVYNDISYHTLDGVAVAIAATHGNTEMLDAVAAWAGMFKEMKVADSQQHEART